jgi:hypothetical protein
MPRTSLILLCASVLALFQRGSALSGASRLVLQPVVTSEPVQLPSDFLSFSIEPAYWVGETILLVLYLSLLRLCAPEFFGTANEPNLFSLRLLEAS